MHIDKYETTVGEYIDPTGCAWESAEDFLQGYVLGFCCCGQPDANLKFIAQVLKHINELKTEVWSKNISFEDWQFQGSTIASENALYFAYYFLDQKELTEHGGSVPGWLTDKGIEFMEDVNELYKTT